MRAFIALPVPAPTRAGLAESQRRLRGAAEALGLRVKWVRPEQLHVCLKFLGDIDAEAARVLGEAVVSRARQEAPVVASLTRLTAFGPPRRARVLAIGVDDPAGHIAELAAHFARAAEPLGIAPERRPFVPHVTFGRLRAPSDATRLLGESFETEQPVVFDQLVLYESTLTPAGPEHRLLAGGGLAGPCDGKRGVMEDLAPPERGGESGA
jgi:2'-5' RNA ligase